METTKSISATFSAEILSIIFDVKENKIHVNLFNNKSTNDISVVTIPVTTVWSQMNTTQKTIIKGFFKELAAQALEVDSTTIAGEFTELQ